MRVNRISNVYREISASASAGIDITIASVRRGGAGGAIVAAKRAEAIVADRIDEADDLRVALRHLSEAAEQLGYDYFDDAPYAAPVEQQPRRRSWWQ